MLNEKRIAGEVRAEKLTDGVSKIAGLGVKYNSLSQDFGGWQERFQAGAFDLSVGNIRCLFNHDSNYVLGDTVSKTLRLADKSDGLHFECDLPKTQTIQDLVGDPIARGTINGCSFMFRALDTKWETLGDLDVRTVLKAEIFEVGPVTWPAYTDTNVSARAVAELAEYRTAKATPVVSPRLAAIADKIMSGQGLTDAEALEFRALADKFSQLTKIPFNPVEAAQRARTLRLIELSN